MATISDGLGLVQNRRVHEKGPTNNSPVEEQICSPHTCSLYFVLYFHCLYSLFSYQSQKLFLKMNIFLRSNDVI